jgi:surfeit locus 1 family protein
MARPGGGAAPGTASRGRPDVASVALVLLLLAAAYGFARLGVWQLHRRVWKRDLIARVDARVHAPPSPAPGPTAWPGLSDRSAGYRRVEAEGVYRNDRETRVEAVTVLGGGFWVLTPLVTRQGFTILVNRGYVPPERAWPSTRPEGQIDGPTRVVGLLRISEPHGGFLRRNDPVHDRWYSRDVVAIARARGLGPVAPYFIDADATGRPSAPVGGLTVTRFPNSHLVYALTWGGLALMSAAAAGWIGWTAVRERRGSGGEARV